MSGADMVRAEGGARALDVAAPELAALGIAIVLW